MHHPAIPIDLSTRIRVMIVAIAAVVVASPSESRAATWGATNPGNILTNGNWSGGTAPNSIDSVAQFTTNPTAAGDFTLSAPWKIGQLIYNNTGQRSITGSGTLTFQVSSGNALFHSRDGAGGA